MASDGKNFLNEIFKNWTVHDVANLTKENILKMGNKDDVSNCLTHAMNVIESIIK